MIFVFGSNLAGRHEKGAALHAVTYHGAIKGKGSGRQGQSWAIPTKTAQLRPLPLSTIEQYVMQFLTYAKASPNLDFALTPVGTGYAKHSKKDIAGLFRKHGLPANVYLTSTWLD